MSIKTKAITSIDDGLVRAAAIIINKLFKKIYVFVYYLFLIQSSISNYKTNIKLLGQEEHEE
jgi:hypothetical protein